MLLFEIVVVTLLGLVLGSLTTAMIYRVPRDVSWVSGRSKCTSCFTTLQIYDLVPVFSCLLAGRKCRHCKAPIPLRYPLTEAGVVFLCLGVYAAYGFTAPAFFIIAAVPFLAALFMIDLDFLILPNQLVLVVGGIGVARLFYEVFSPYTFSFTEQIFIPYVLGAGIFAGLSWALGFFMTKVLKRDALGFGDVKFFAVAGLWLGISYLPAFYILSGVLGILFSIIWRSVKKEDVFPFGPALITSLYVLLLFEGSLFS